MDDTTKHNAPTDPLEQDAAQQKTSLTELSRIVGGLAHEIKNPLSTINLNLKLLAEDIDRHDDDEHHRWARRLVRVQNETDRVRAILDDFLRYAGQFEAHLTRVNLCDVVGELYDFFQPQAEASRVVLRISTPEAPIFCDLDPKLFKQALLNLLLNATQAMSSGGDLVIKVAASDVEITLEVIDTGPGIAPETLQTIFQPYVSTKPDGSGLGLPTAQRILRAHGGSIRIQSELGKGTRFILTLPPGKKQV